MEVTLTGREARLLVESTIESVKAKQEERSSNYELAFSVAVVPGVQTDSGVLSYLDKLLDAISKFGNLEPMKLVLNVNNVDLLEDIQKRFEGAVKLSLPDKKIVMPGEK